MIPFFISLTLALSTISAFSQASNEPTELTTLRNAWATQKTAASKVVDEKYAISLSVMKDKFLKAVNLEAAVSVDNELKALMANAHNAKIVSDLIGEWQWGQNRIRFHADRTLDERNKSGAPVTTGKWKTELDGTVALLFDNGYSAVMTLGRKLGNGLAVCSSPEGHRNNVVATKIDRSQK